MRWALITLAAALVAGPAAAQPGPDALARASRGIARVNGYDCAGVRRSATGFAWQQPGRVVTALHVVADCARVSVQFLGSAERPARITNASRESDLALLSVAEPPPGVQPLELAERVPAVSEVVQVYGYALEIATPVNAALTVLDANRFAFRLREALNAAAEAELRQTGVPSMDVQVLRTDGNILPGQSGAPVIDRDGRVVAVGSGGLERGAVGIGWSVRAQYVARLPAAADPPQLGPGSGSVRYAVPTRTDQAGPSPAAPQRLHCGGLDLVLARTRGLAELHAGTDNPQGFAFMASLANEPLANFNALQFDVWTDLASGGGIAVPAGTRPEPRGIVCVAAAAGAPVMMVFGGARLPHGGPADPSWVQIATATAFGFMQAVAPLVGVPLFPVPQLSYLAPQVLPGGLLVHRQFFAGPNPQAAWQVALNQTMLAKNETFLGVAAINRGFAVPDPRIRQLFIHASFAAMLSTIPPDSR
jgi:hypothetical protein